MTTHGTPGELERKQYVDDVYTVCMKRSTYYCKRNSANVCAAKVGFRWPSHIIISIIGQP